MYNIIYNIKYIMENNILYILIVATAENRQYKSQDDIDNMPDLIDKEGNIFNDNSSELDNKKDEYFKILIELYSYDYIIKYKTICPSYYSDFKVKKYDDPNYLGHIDSLVSDINIEEHNNMFNCILVTSAYSDMYNQENILVFDKLLKKNGLIVTTHPKGIYELLSSNYKHYASCKKPKIGNFNIFIKL
jgi:hypothetical protein